MQITNCAALLLAVSVLLTACGSSDDSDNNTADTTAPSIFLLGNNPVDLTVGSNYTDSGATALDNIDGDISAKIISDFSAVDSSVTGSYTVTYNVSDSAGNVATQVTRTIMVVAQNASNNLPSVSVNAPANGATVSAIITLSADATDDVSVAGVQFQLDGINIGAEDITAPYSISFDTTTTSNGSHNLTAIARDSANQTRSDTVNVTVSNAAPMPPACSDSLDNDSDGLTDFPDDPGCVSATDTDEMDVPVNSVSVNPASKTLTIGAIQTIIATLSPGNASNKNVFWDSDTPSVATVSNSGVVTANSAGTATITVTTADGNKIATTVITVSPADSFVHFNNAKDIANDSVSGISSLDVGDLNGDGRGDIIAIEGGKHASGRKTFAWFEAPITIQGSWTRHEFGNNSQLRSFLGSAKLADMDGDGDLDLIVSSDNHSGSSKQADLYVYVNPGSGSVTGSWSFHRVTSSTLALHHINDMEIADLDADGKLDIIVRSLDPNQIHIFFQNSISSYTHKTINTNISQSEGLSVGFLDGDNLPDITYTGHWLKSPANPRTGNYTKLNIDSNYKNNNQNTKEAIGDIDGDGKNDVIISPAEAFRNGGNTILAWYKNPGNTSSNNWEKHIILNLTNNTHTVKLGDMDNDGDLDVITGTPWSNSASSISVNVYYNDSSGSFSAAQVVVSGKGLYSGVVFDIEGDGDLDIIGQNIYSRTSKPYVYENLLN